MIILQSLLIAALLMSEPRDTMESRIRASIAAGTGGAEAAFALCHLPAIVEFVDGHQTPALVTNAAVWESYLHGRNESEPPIRSDLPHKQQVEFKEFIRRFEEEGLRLAKLVKSASDPDQVRRESKALSSRAVAEAGKRAETGLVQIERDLKPSDRARFHSWLEEQKKRTIVLRVDYRKIDSFTCN